MTDVTVALLEEAHRYLREEVAPQANAIDRDPEALREALRGLCTRGLMSLRRPREFGGPEVGEVEFRLYQEAVARASGALAFLQTQHQSAVGMLAKSQNEALRAETLPRMHDGTRLVGIGFSQLRRPGDPVMRATPEDGGYRLDGHVPWVTGAGFYPEYLLGASLPDGQAVFGLVPLEDGPGCRVSSPMRLAALETAMTVTVDYDGAFLPAERVAFVRPGGWIADNDQINVTLQGFFALGCAQAGLDVVWRAFEKRGAAFIQASWERLNGELERCRQAMAASLEPASDLSGEEKHRLRAWTIDLAARCSHAGVVASSGAANGVDHDAQRVYREALVFSVSAQTSTIMEATLERLVGRGQ